MRRGGERVVRLQLDHRPDRNPHRGQRLLERMELRQERRLDPFARLVAVPLRIAEGFDHVIGRNAQVRGSRLHHLEDRAQDAEHRSIRRILALREAAQPVEMAE